MKPLYYGDFETNTGIFWDDPLQCSNFRELKQYLIKRAKAKKGAGIAHVCILFENCTTAYECMISRGGRVTKC